MSRNHLLEFIRTEALQKPERGKVWELRYGANNQELKLPRLNERGDILEEIGRQLAQKISPFATHLTCITAEERPFLTATQMQLIPGKQPYLKGFTEDGIIGYLPLEEKARITLLRGVVSRGDSTMSFINKLKQQHGLYVHQVIAILSRFPQAETTLPRFTTLFRPEDFLH